MAVLRGFLQCLLKLFNFIYALLGIGLVFYAIIMLNEWKKQSAGGDDAPPPSSLTINNSQLDELMQHHLASVGSIKLSAFEAEHNPGSNDFITLPAPWFIYAFLGAGSLICLVTFSGAVAAETHSTCCLSFYQFGAACLLIMQIIIVAFLYLDRSWDKELPNDPTGQLAKLERFINDNRDILKVVGFVILAVQVIAIVLAMTLQALQDGKVSKADDEEGREVEEPLLQGTQDV